MFEGRNRLYVPSRKHSARHLSAVNTHFGSLTKFILLSITTSSLLSLSDQVRAYEALLSTIKYYTDVSYYNEIMFYFNLPQQCLRTLRKQVLSIQRPEFESKVKEKQWKNNLTDLYDNSRRNHVKHPKEKWRSGEKK